MVSHSSTPLCPVLAAVAAELARSYDVGSALLRELDEESGNRAPQRGKWSPLQAIEHLNVTADCYRPPMERAIEGAQPGAAPYRSGTWVGRLLLRSVDPGSSRALPAPRLFRPSTARLDPSRVRSRFEFHHQVWQDLARAADGLDLGRARVRLPVAPLLRISLEQAFRLHAAHEARHLGQAYRARDLTRNAAV